MFQLFDNIVNAANNVCFRFAKFISTYIIMLAVITKLCISFSTMAEVDLSSSILPDVLRTVKKESVDKVSLEL